MLPASSSATNPTGPVPASATKPSLSWAMPPASRGHAGGIAACQSDSTHSRSAAGAKGRICQRIAGILAPGSPTSMPISALASSPINPDVIPQAKTGPDVGHQRAQVPAGLPEPVLDAGQPSTFDKPLLVEYPFASGRETALGRRQHGLAQVRQAGGVVLPPGVDTGEVQRTGRQPVPGGRRGLPQLLRESRAGQVTGQHPAKSQFPNQNVGGDPGHIADLAVNLEPPIRGGGGPVQDLVEIPVDEVDLAAIDRQPGPAVHDVAPLAHGEHPASPARLCRPGPCRPGNRGRNPSRSPPQPYPSPSNPRG